MSVIKTALTAYAGALLTLLVLDAIWLGLTAKSFYRDQLGELMLPQPNLAIAAIFYVFYAAAVVILAVMPALGAASLVKALVLGAVLGLAAYGTYDITNLATLRNWPLAVTIADLVWGALITAATAGGSFAAARYFS